MRERLSAQQGVRKQLRLVVGNECDAASCFNECAMWKLLLLYTHSQDARGQKKKRKKSQPFSGMSDFVPRNPPGHARPMPPSLAGGYLRYGLRANCALEICTLRSAPCRESCMSFCSLPAMFQAFFPSGLMPPASANPAQVRARYEASRRHTQGLDRSARWDNSRYDCLTTFPGSHPNKRLTDGARASAA